MSRSNILEAGTASIAGLFGDYIENLPENGACVTLAISARPIGGTARNAIEKSLVALGYPADSCAYATLTPPAADNVSATDSSPDKRLDGPALDAQALFLLVEGLDPLFVIATDALVVESLGKAYRTDYPADSPIRVFGRSSVAFHDLSSLLESDAGKQKAWRLFKSIPKR